MIESELRTCSIHGTVIFKKHKNGNSTSSFKCSKCAAEAVAKTVKAKQELAYKKYGSCCKICGYDKCKRALEWHHLDPSKKEITPTKVFSRNWEKIQKELDKCVLLCANCHREVHAGLITV